MFIFLFDVGRSKFDVRRSSLETSPYGINTTCECLHNLALMPFHPLRGGGLGRGAKRNFLNIEHIEQVHRYYLPSEMSHLPGIPLGQPHGG